MAEHVALKADPFQQRYKDLPLTVPDDRWRAIVDLTQLDLDRPVEDYLEGPLVPLQGDQRQLQAPEAAMLVYRACLAECTAARHESGISERFWTDFLNAAYGDLTELWRALGGEGAPGYRAYQGLLGTAGLGGGAAPSLPWWIGNKQHRGGALFGSASVGLTSPGALRGLVAALRAGTVLSIVEGFLQERSSDPAIVPRVVAEHERLASFLEEASFRADWVLGFE